jgi:hypothetical protein
MKEFEGKSIYKEIFRRYKNCFEVAVQDGYYDNGITGWSDLIKNHKDTAKVLEMIDNRYNEIGKKIADEFSNHEVASIRFLSAKVLSGESMEVENKKHITM